MTSKEPLVTVVEDIEEGLDTLNEYQKPQLAGSYNTKELLATTFTDDSEVESVSDGGQEIDPMEDDKDMEQSENVSGSTKKKTIDGETSFRGRPSSCVFVASLAASLTDDDLSVSVTSHFEKVRLI